MMLTKRDRQKRIDEANPFPKGSWAWSEWDRKYNVSLDIIGRVTVSERPQKDMRGINPFCGKFCILLINHIHIKAA